MSAALRLGRDSHQVSSRADPHTFILRHHPRLIPSSLLASRGTEIVPITVRQM